jgi:hypothetical protein
MKRAHDKLLRALSGKIETIGNAIPEARKRRARIADIMTKAKGPRKERLQGEFQKQTHRVQHLNLQRVRAVSIYEKILKTGKGQIRW